MRKLLFLFLIIQAMACGRPAYAGGTSSTETLVSVMVVKPSHGNYGTPSRDIPAMNGKAYIKQSINEQAAARTDDPVLKGYFFYPATEIYSVESHPVE